MHSIRPLLACAYFMFVSGAEAASVIALHCDGRRDPMGLDDPQPELSWIISTDLRGYHQRAYQILVASSAALLAGDQGDLWNSHKVNSEESAHVPYAGGALGSRIQAFWKVRVWNQAGQVSAWSKTATWTMGLLQSSDWSAQWITASKWYTPRVLQPPGLMVSPGGWADVDLGAAFPVDAIRLYFSDPAVAPKRFRILAADNLQFDAAQTLVDQSTAGTDIAAGWHEFPAQGFSARHIRLWIEPPSAAAAAQTDSTVKTGPTAQNDPLIAVRQMQVISGGKNVALMRPTREFGTQWHSGHAVFLVDGMPSADDGPEAPPDACPLPTAPVLRKEFTLGKPIKRATIYVAALGMADVTINGRAVTDDVLGPPFTDYTKRVVYETRDVTGLLSQGENVVGVTLGNGFFSPPMRGFGGRHNGNGPPRVMLQTEIEYRDGTRQVIGSDANWTWARSEITYNDTFARYDEDRTLAHPGWDRPGYDDAAWAHAATIGSLSGRLVAHTGPPIRVLGELKPNRVQGNHAYFDNLSTGWPQLKVNGKAHQKIVIIGHAPGYDAPPLTFTLAAAGPATLQPRFMYTSAPLDIEVQGLDQDLSADDVRILEVHADLKSAGDFESSNLFLNKIHESLLRTHLNYDGDQPMDPQREKQGWTQDAQGMFETAAYLTDVSGIYHKWWRDFGDAQDESGYVGSVLPLVGRQVYDWNSPWWSGASVLLPWQHYLFYGDRRMLAESYEVMRRYVDFIGRLADSGSVRSWGDYPYLNHGYANSPEAHGRMLAWMGAGDWQSPFDGRDGVPAVLLDMPAWYLYANIVAKSGALLGKTQDARKYAEIAAQVRVRFNAVYLDRATGMYGGNPRSQTPQVLALALGLVPPGQSQKTHERLIDAIHLRDDHLGVGFVALPWLLHVLIESGDTALGNKIVNQQTFPGWNTLMHDGVLGEDWHGGGAQMPSCGGAVGLWLYQSVLGIRPDPAGPGFKKFIIAPQPDPGTGLTWAHGRYASNYGDIVSDWRMDGARFTLRASIPANTTATISIPTRGVSSVREGRSVIGRATGVRFLRYQGGHALYEVGSGRYEFTAAL